MPAPITGVDPELRRWATTTAQKQLLDEIDRLGSLTAAAAAIGIGQSAASERLAAIRKKAAKANYAPGSSNISAPVPEGFAVKRLSARFDKEGNPAGGWLISEPDKEQHEVALRAAIEAFAAEIKPLPPVLLERAAFAEHLLNVYTITDYHFNMLAWGPEAGEDWDMDIAARTLRLCFRAMVDRCPPAETCVIAQLGDFAHTDGFKNATPTSGHELDADSRFEKAVELMLIALRDVIEYAATRHRKVIVLLAEGNHDIDSSKWFRAAFSMLYAHNDRVDVIKSARPFYAVEFGKTMLGWHHGHLVKTNNLPLVFATDFSEMWGRTKYRVIHTGHYHHRDVKEHPGVEVYQHPTLAASDAYAARGGWRSLRRAVALTYHKELGEVGSVIVSPEMVGAA